MKLFAVMIILFSCSFSQASRKIQCNKYAQQQAAQFLKVSMREFKSEMGLVWWCKSRKNPAFEEIQYGNGSLMVGVSLQVINGRCELLKAYTGADERDSEMSWDKENCF